MGSSGVLGQCGGNCEKDQAESHPDYHIPPSDAALRLGGGGVCIGGGEKKFGIGDRQNGRRIRALFVFGDAFFDFSGKRGARRLAMRYRFQLSGKDRRRRR